MIKETIREHVAGIGSALDAAFTDEFAARVHGACELMTRHLLREELVRLAAEIPELPWDDETLDTAVDVMMVVAPVLLALHESAKERAFNGDLASPDLDEQ